MIIDAGRAIREIENLLRDFAEGILKGALGQNWLEKCGASADRIDKWRERKEIEQKRQEGGVVEPRLIYYADFYDIQTILKKQWSAFSPALGDWKTMEVYLGELEKLRDALAHGRELMPHQNYLVNGIVGEIRTRLIRYRSKLETSEDYFPRIESARDNIGNVWTQNNVTGFDVFTKSVLRAGDRLEFTVTASDPLGEDLDYRIRTNQRLEGRSNSLGIPWKQDRLFAITITSGCIGKHFTVCLEVKSRRKHHAVGECDDHVEFHYTVLPKLVLG